MERPYRCADTNPARDKIERCDDMVFCGTASALAISPAGRPSGSPFTNSLNTSSRVGWASAASARMASSDSIYPELWIYGGMSSDAAPNDPALSASLFRIFRSAAGRRGQISNIALRSRPSEGRAHVTDVGRDAVDAGGVLDEQCRRGRPKSCRSAAPIVGVKSAIRSAGDGVKKRGHRGEREVSRKTIARGMPGRSGVTVVTK